MNTPRISHPTGRTNYSEVSAGGITYAFSYDTCVGFYGRGGRVTRENAWGPTTGKHLNYWDGGSPEARALRLPSDAFEAALILAQDGAK